MEPRENGQRRDGAARTKLRKAEASDGPWRVQGKATRHGKDTAVEPGRRDKGRDGPMEAASWDSVGRATRGVNPGCDYTRSKRAKDASLRLRKQCDKLKGQRKTGQQPRDGRLNKGKQRERERKESRKNCSRSRLVNRNHRNKGAEKQGKVDAMPRTARQTVTQYTEPK